MPGSESSPETGMEVRTYFVRHRNALVARADFADLYLDYYLHLADHGLRHEPDHDAMLKTALAAVTLHLASRPWHESVAWTLHFQEPLLNAFVAGGSHPGRVVGHLFTENVKPVGHNLLYSDVSRPQHPLRRSVVSFEGSDPFLAAEQLYRQSEQRPARYFQHAAEDIVMISAQPECDLDWLEGLDAGSARRLDEEEELSLLEQRTYVWSCGCSQMRMFALLAPTMTADPDALFDGEESIRISCPRCGARYAVTREGMEAFVAGEASPGA